MQKIKNYIGGETVEPIGGKFLDNIDPSTGEVYSYVPDSDEQDVERAYTAAAMAFPAWSKMPVEQRSRALIKMLSPFGRKTPGFPQ